MPNLHLTVTPEAWDQFKKELQQEMSEAVKEQIITAEYSERKPKKKERKNKVTFKNIEKRILALEREVQSLRRQLHLP